MSKTPEEIALELVQCEKQNPSTAGLGQNAIEMYADYLKKVHKAYSDNNT